MSLGSENRPQRSCAPFAVLWQKPEMYVLVFLTFTPHHLIVFVSDVICVPLATEFKTVRVTPAAAPSTDVRCVDQATLNKTSDCDIHTLFIDRFLWNFHFHRRTCGCGEVHREFRHVPVPSTSS